MALPAQPPKYVPKPGVGIFHSDPGGLYEPIHRGRSGWPVYSLQRAVGVVPATGNFGAVTLRKVKEFQAKYGLTVDAIAGPATQQKILDLAGAKADQAHGLPIGLGRGFAKAEGANLLAATNWSVAGGVDCGPAQWRISGPPFSLDRLKRAFRPYEALDHACKAVAERRASFKQRNSHFTGDEALRVALLAHNWPAGADRIVRNYPGGGNWWRYVPSPDADASWVEGFTHAEWAAEYPKRLLIFTAGP